MPLQNFVSKVTNVTAAWLNSVDALLFTVFGTPTTKQQALANVGMGSSVAFVDGAASQYATIQAAVNAAGASGYVVITPDYAGTDSYTNASNIPIIDLRNAQFGIWSVIAPGLNTRSGADLYPQGHDLVARVAGPADLFLEHLNAATTTAANLSIGANNNTLVGAVNVGNVTRGALRTGTTALLSTATGVGLTIARGQANEEFVTAANWSIVDGTHLNITCAKTHSGTTDIEQIGTTVLATRTLKIGANLVKASQEVTNPAMQLMDATNVPILYVPSDSSATFPANAFQFNARITGANGANSDLLIQVSSAAGVIKLLNHLGASIGQLDDTGHLLVVAGMEYGTNATTLNGATGTMQIGRGGAASPTSTADAFLLWQTATDALNPSGIAGSLGVMARNLASTTINFITQNVVRAVANALGLQVIGALSVGQSATAPAITNNGTITTAATGEARVAPAGAVTGIILQSGTVAGQTCTVVNESAAVNTVTFDVAGTSHVADGVSSVIAGLTARRFAWDSVTSLWYPCK